MNATSLPTAWFDALYARDRDPWRFASSAYERAKYGATLQALAWRRFGRAFEVGCSIGILTRQLAPRCDSLLAVDVAATAVEQAQQHCAGLEHVAIQQLRIPDAWPRQSFDLILLSEVLYYLSSDDVVRSAELTRARLRPDGIVLLVHYTGPTDYPCTGDAACDLFISASRLAAIRQRRQTAYRLDLLRA